MMSVQVKQLILPKKTLVQTCIEGPAEKSIGTYFVLSSTEKLGRKKTFQGIETVASYNLNAEIRGYKFFYVTHKKYLLVVRYDWHM